MPFDTASLSAIHRAIWKIRESSRGSGSVDLRRQLIRVERALIGMLLKAEAERPEEPAQERRQSR
ncbi:hypothetical protein [Azospirillum sp. SYSU D00513]|uniref:hypothetical protein n=1 Tax=Azospirillum sp. SYSU D00513 TaxID=2812561 RepID=UPI001A9784A9|nr:hypothetical protein [Azospirillum sp. SYSU D00513]